MIFSTQQPRFLSAKFVYNYYERDEFINEVDITDRDKLEFPPRLVELNFSKVESIVASNNFGQKFNEHINEIITQKDKITSELLL
ncbi:MAG TPA: hypothetical protein DD671_07330, partial [Balneolaceae bacterium]|nr:hypothetical protein [Balneolaceae bacterium]